VKRPLQFSDTWMACCEGCGAIYDLLPSGDTQTRKMIRRRPIPRTRSFPEVSQHFELILEGAVRRYSDGREVCVDSAAGWREYKRRVSVMLQRQNFRCCLCNRRLSLANATFEHQRRRGMGAAWRDDRLETADGKLNGAAHWICNSQKG
jgi:hypothetical protein